MNAAWQYIRLLRATRPALVTEDRVGVFSSALEQSEQLMRAAEEVGPAARPLPLFYALSQAGRAIAAARIDDSQWRLSGHGLSVGSTPGQADLLRRTVTAVEASKKAIAEGRGSSFAGVAEAIKSAPLRGSVELGAVWCAIPDLIPPITPQMPQLDPQWRRPLVVFDFYWDHGEHMSGMFGPNLSSAGSHPEQMPNSSRTTYRTTRLRRCRRTYRPASRRGGDSGRGDDGHHAGRPRLSPNHVART